MRHNLTREYLLHGNNFAFESCYFETILSRKFHFFLDIRYIEVQLQILSHEMSL